MARSLRYVSMGCSWHIGTFISWIGLIDSTMQFLILAVDDDPAILEVLTELLRDEGYRVHCAEDGQMALDLAATEDPDVILSDVTMPRIDGVELVRRLRSRGQSVPVVLISARYTAVDLPGVRFLTKPFDVDHLVAAIERSLTQGAP